MHKYVLFIFLIVDMPFARSQTAVRDNSFLIEEAYNQEQGVIQHIQAMQFDRTFKDASCSFTEEWPVSSDVHQVSLTIPYGFSGENKFVLNDLLVNYRYQLVSREHLFLAPRLSVILPSGNSPVKGNAGMSGFQVNIPVSFEISRKLTIHANIGNTSTWLTGKRHALSREKSESLAYGMSMIYFLNHSVNLLVETIHSASFNENYSGSNEIEKTTIISPGIRFAIDFSSGMQIVPGMAFPYELHSKTNSYFLYLSVEHPFKKIKS